MRYVILCRVEGGVTGTREAFLKEQGQVRVFETRTAAQTEAARLTFLMNGEYARATFTYTPLLHPGEERR